VLTFGSGLHILPQSTYETRCSIGRTGKSVDVNLIQKGKITLEGFGLIPNKVLCVDDRETVLQAFKLIIENSVSGVAVVNSKGKLCGNLSASDFSGITEQNFLKLDIPLGQFVGSQVFANGTILTA
jgi:hypothetical protein